MQKMASWSLRDATGIHFVKMVPQRMATRSALGRCSVVFFIKQAPWRTEARSLEDAAAFRGHGAMELAKARPRSTSSIRCHEGRRSGACGDAATMLRWMDEAR